MTASPEEVVILDASAVLAIVRRERGADGVRRLLPRSCISVINWAEVMDVCFRESLDVRPLRAFRAAGLRIIPLTVEQAEIAAGLRVNVRTVNVSLADCCCLAAGVDLDVPVYTADSAWEDLRQPVDVRLVR